MPVAGEETFSTPVSRYVPSRHEFRNGFRAPVGGCHAAVWRPCQRGMRGRPLRGVTGSLGRVWAHPTTAVEER